MNIFKSKSGFSLVELIVVIAILGILAGVAIPAYNGYITKAQDVAVETELAAIKTAAQAANATEGEVTGISVDASGKLTLTVKTASATGSATADIENEVAKDFETFYTDCTLAASTTAGKTNTHSTITIDNFGALIANTSYSEKGATWSSEGWKPTT